MTSRPSPATPPLDLERACRVAAEAAEAAGALLRDGMAEPLEIRPKGSAGDVVTELDVAAETLILGRLRDAFPDHRIIAEESGAGGGDGRDGHLWLVDPLDGTNNVAIGMPVYAVGLALCAGGWPVLGVVHDPVTGRTWSATRGGGTRGPDGTPLRAAPARPGRAGNPVVAWTQGTEVGRGDPAAARIRARLEARAGRLLQLWAPLVAWAMLARGDIDGFVGYRAELVDLPAGALIALEAGVEIRGLGGGPYDLNIDRPDRSFIAARPAILGDLLASVSA